MSEAVMAGELGDLREAGLGWLRTVDPHGRPHVAPVAWRYNDVLETVDVMRPGIEASREFRNAQVNPDVTLVVDEAFRRPSPTVVVRGVAQPLDHLPSQYVAGGALIRLTPRQVMSWVLERDEQ